MPEDRDELRELIDRLDSAYEQLLKLRDETPSKAFERKTRLSGKAEGVALAMSYAMDELRMRREGLAPLAKREG